MPPVFATPLNTFDGDGYHNDGDAWNSPRTDENEGDQLLKAWSLERGRSIECSLLLEDVRRLLARIAAEDRLSPRHERAAKRLLRSIRQFRNTDSPPGVEP